MSLKTLPILFINMGGEMAYILDQRLQAQQVRKDKALKVLGDIISTMYSQKFMNELFKPQELYSRRAFRTLFDKLAHASIMRLNTTSMDKLYDLMTMAVKYQLQACTGPRDMLLMTLNHMDGVRKLVQGAANLQSQIDHAFDLFTETYAKMNIYELSVVRSTLLTFYQDAKIKVSLLLREKKQREDGRFVIPIKRTKVPYGGAIPGAITIYSGGKVSKTNSFNSTGSYTETTDQGTLEKAVKVGERGTELGFNMYKTHAPELQGGSGFSYGSDKDGQAKDTTKEELNLLSRLLASAEVEAKSDFTLDLFDSKEDEKKYVKEAEKAAKDEQIIHIDASQRKKPVDKLMEDLSVDKEKKKKKKAKGDELLDLMDNAE